MINFRILTASIILASLLGCKSNDVSMMEKAGTEQLASGQFDGRYNTSLAFSMGPATVCPSALPITIELQVEGSNIQGIILNDGGQNTHQFCAVYHNGTIEGSLTAAGDLKSVTVKQKDPHSRQYSSYKIIGNITGELTLISRAAQYHPKSTFSLNKSN